MGWHYTCPFCKESAKHAMLSCCCQQEEDRRIVALMKGAMIVDFFVDKTCPITFQYFHILKDGEDYYIRYCPNAEGVKEGFSEIEREIFELHHENDDGSGTSGTSRGGEDDDDGEPEPEQVQFCRDFQRGQCHRPSRGTSRCRYTHATPEQEAEFTRTGIMPQLGLLVLAEDENAGEDEDQDQDEDHGDSLPYPVVSKEELDKELDEIKAARINAYEMAEYKCEYDRVRCDVVVGKEHIETETGESFESLKTFAENILQTTNNRSYRRFLELLVLLKLNE